jgi:hypothetical protein
VVVDVRTEADAAILKNESILEELLANRLLLVIDEEVVGKAELPAALLERFTPLEVATWGCFFNDARLNAHATKQLLTQIKPKGSGLPSHYSRLSVLHMSAAVIAGEAFGDLCDILKSKECNLRTLDLSHTSFDGAALVAALKENRSLHSLDVRMVDGIEGSFEAIGDMLLAAGSTSQLAYLRCDAFEVVEAETTFSLKERAIDKGACRLLTGLLKNNTVVQEVDLSATHLQKEWVTALVETLIAAPASKVAAVHLNFNPAIDLATQRALLAAVEGKTLKTALYF